MAEWVVGETRVVAGVPHVVVVCAGRCKQKVLVRKDEEGGDDEHFCMECAGLNRAKPGFGGVAYGHQSDANYHGGYSE